MADLKGKSVPGDRANVRQGNKQQTNNVTGTFLCKSFFVMGNFWLQELFRDGDFSLQELFRDRDFSLPELVRDRDFSLQELLCVKWTFPCKIYLVTVTFRYNNYSV